jgi:hypothetical protein
MSLDMGQYPSVSRAEQTTSYTGGADLYRKSQVDRNFSFRSEIFLCGQKFRLSGQKFFYVDRNSDYPVRNFSMWTETIIRSEIFLCGQKFRLSGQKFFYVDRNSDYAVRSFSMWTEI